MPDMKQGTQQLLYVKITPRLQQMLQITQLITTIHTVVILSPS